MHYRRGVRDSARAMRAPKPSRDEAFWQRVIEGTGGCWLWTGPLTRGDYGTFMAPNGKMTRVHRYAYEVMVGPIPEGLELDHLCRVRLCVNPAHLDPVTHAVNVVRAYAVRSSHCTNGHPMTAENTYKDPKRGHRQCRTCRREADHRRRSGRAA